MVNIPTVSKVFAQKNHSTSIIYINTTYIGIRNNFKQRFSPKQQTGVTMLNTQKAEAFPRSQPRSSGHKRVQKENVYDAIKQRAAAMDIALTKERLEVVDFVLDFYAHCEDCRNARQLMKVMDQEFAEKGGKKYLYRLFPQGPLSQIHELTNLPDLRNQVDNGFGTSY